MKKAKSRFISMALTCVMLLGMLPGMQLTVDAAAISESEIRARIDTLASALVGTYFNVNHSSTDCNGGVWQCSHGCSNCDVGNVIQTAWLKNLIGAVPSSTSQLPNADLGRGGQSCYGFANFAEWYIFRESNSSTVDVSAVASCNFNYSDMSKYARVGDIIRIHQGSLSAGHSLIFISADSSGIYALDCNGAKGEPNCAVRRWTFYYSSVYPYAKVYRANSSSFVGQTSTIESRPFVGYGYTTQGSAVSDLQTMLNKVNGAGLDVDGIFGTGTYQAVKNYQSRKGLTADGICGDATWAALEADYKVANTSATSQPSSISGSSNREYVGWGYTTQGSAVSDLQTMLNKVIGAGLVVDGIFGNSTYYAVQTYQSRKGLTADGICGIDTWTALETDYKAANATSTPTTIAVSSISIPSTLTLKKGETWPFSATVLPSNATNKKVTWTSSNNLVVTIDTDHLTGVNPGTARVMASAGGKSAICLVTVTEPEVTVTRVALSRTSLSLKQGEEQALTLMISPSDATDKTETWSSSNPSVATAKKGIITGVSAGTATITVKVGEKTATCTVTVSADVHKHTLTHTSTKAATEQSTGNIEYWYCSACGKYFSDADATKEISKEQTIVAQLNHTHKLVYSAKKDATCTEGGNTEFWRCSDCSKYFSDAQGKNEISAQSILTAALGHNYVNGACSRCGEKQTNATKNQFGNITLEKQTLYFQGQFNDVPANQWFTNGVASAVEFGLMKGSDNGFNPYGDVTLAEAITMAARINSIYSTGAESFDQSVGNAWYQTYLDYAYQNGIISRAYYNSDVTNKATRSQFAEIFAKCLPDEALPEGNSISDNAIPDVGMSDSFAQYVYKLYRAGILIGGDANGTFSPLTYITRAEAATIVSRMADSNNRVSISLN